MALPSPAAVTPDDGDPFIAGRSPDGRWCVVAHLGLSEGGRFYIADLEVTPWDDGAVPLGGATLRRLPLGRWLTEAHALLATLADRGLREGRVSEELERLARSRRTPAPGRRAAGGWDYRRLALEYLELQGQGVSRGIRDRLAAIETRRQRRPVSALNVRDALTVATRRGFLSKGAPGRAGRLPGPRLFEEGEG